MRDEGFRKMKSAISGALVVDKPTGITSHDVVQIVRKGTGLRRIGHTGTLDPCASGVLVLLVGPAVRLSDVLFHVTKQYEATIHLGSVSSTYDREGNIEAFGETYSITMEQVEEAMKKFTGEITQVPPAYSAIKINGRKACDMARAGVEFELKSRRVNVLSFDLIEFTPPDLTVDILCSSGTYIRSIAHDLGQELGCGAFLSGLRRTKCGKFSLRNAVTIPDLKKALDEGVWYQYLIPAAETIPEYQEIILTMETEPIIRHGHRLPAEPGSQPVAKAVSLQGELIALLEFCPETCEWQPRKVFYP